MKNISLAQARKSALKGMDAWTEVLLCDPVSLPLAYVLAKYTKVSPYLLVALTLMSRLVSATCFWQGWFIVGGILAFAGFILDGTDGKLARILKQDETLRGAADFILDQVGYAAMLLGLASFIVAANIGALSLMLLFLWVVLYFVHLSLTSTAYRLMNEAGVSISADAAEVKKAYQEGIRATKDHLLRKLFSRSFNLYFWVRDKTARHRMLVLPMPADSQVLLFIIAPVFANVLNTPIVFAICIAFACFFMIPQSLATALQSRILISLIERN